MKRKILFLTGSRAEYGLLRNLIKLFKGDKELNTYLAVTGSHLSKTFGSTHQEILKDKLKIDKEVKIPLNDSSHGISVAISKFLLSFSAYLRDLAPDLLIILGDRYEVFAAAVAAHTHNIDIAHIHGGELTEGAYDDAFRHSITKMSALHFTSCEEYRKRIIQLGESPSSVYNVGSLGIEAIDKNSFKSKVQLESELNINFLPKTVLVTFHPETKLSGNENSNNLNELIDALSFLQETQIIFTGVNADTGHKSFKKLIQKFSSKKQHVHYFDSLGQTNYFSLLNYVDMVIGNSSSGILEVPAFNIPTINIGNRQKGRAQDSSIINCKANQKEILRSINKAYNSSNHNQIKLIYKKRNSAKKIYEAIKSKKKIKQMKTFYDINF